MNRKLHLIGCAGLLLALSHPAAAQTQNEGDPIGDTVKKAGDIASQPAKDVGVAKTEIPPLLVKAGEDPYSLSGINNCDQLAAAIRELNGVLGPDFAVGGRKKESKAGKLAEAGSASVINSLIPFRGIVREVSGAAPAQRRLNTAIDAGYARRGFLRGTYQARGCKAAI